MSDRKEVRQFVLDWIEDHARELTGMSDRIWLYAEPPLQEYRSSALHVETLRRHGFQVDYGVAGMPTAFVATWGEGKTGPGGLCRIRRNRRTFATTEHEGEAAH